MTVGRDNLVELVEAILEPLVLGLAIWCFSYYVEGEVTTPALIASLLGFSLTFPGRSRLQDSVWRSIGDLLVSWILIATLILPVFRLCDALAEALFQGSDHSLSIDRPLIQVLEKIAETDNDWADSQQHALLETEYPSKYDL